MNSPKVHDYIKEMNKKILSSGYPTHLVFHQNDTDATGHDLITVGETPFTDDAQEIAAYVLPSNKELNMAFDFELMGIDTPVEGDPVPLAYRSWSLSQFKEIIGRWQRFERSAGFWNTYVSR
jgi:glycosidase